MGTHKQHCKDTVVMESFVFVLRGSLRASAVTVWKNCQLSPVMCGKLNLTLLPIDVVSLFRPLWQAVKALVATLPFDSTYLIVPIQ